jgi:hypothetical protein
MKVTIVFVHSHEHQSTLPSSLSISESSHATPSPLLSIHANRVVEVLPPLANYTAIYNDKAAGGLKLVTGVAFS